MLKRLVADQAILQDLPGRAPSGAMSAAEAIPVPAADESTLGPNECWSRNFITSILAAGRRFRCLTLIDDYIREWPGLEVEHSRPGTRIVDVLEGSAGTRGLTEVLICENGPELNRQALDACPIGTASTLDFIRPGKPDENCFIDNFNGSFRDECLNEYRFTTFADARRRIELWRRDYNQVRPHSSLGNPPAEDYAEEYRSTS